MLLNFELLKKELNKIRDDEGGYCLSVTMETTRVLLTGDSAQQISWDNYTADREKGFGNLKKQICELDPKYVGISQLDKKEFAEKEKIIFFNLLNKSEPGTIFVVSTGDEDHYYNILKTDNDTLLLIDADAYLYKELKDPYKDFSVTETDLDKVITTIEAISGLKLANPKKYLNSNFGLTEGYDYFDAEEHPVTLYVAGKVNAHWLVPEQQEEVVLNPAQKFNLEKKK